MRRAFLYSGAMIEGPRGARREELPEIIGLSNRVFYPDGRVRMERVLPMLFANANVRNLRILVDESKVVAMAGMVISDLTMDEIRVRAACIGSVCTREEHRGRGLAAALMEDAVSHAASRGACLALISGGRGLYRRMGCVDAGLFRVIDVTRAGAGRTRPASGTRKTCRSCTSCTRERRSVSSARRRKIIDRTAFTAALAPRGLPPALPDAPEDLAAAVFGSVERSGPPLAEALPLSLPGYGLNYI